MAKSNKFGTFGGVFTPSILTILGVIMYLRLPMIVGQAGLWATLGIIIVAHLISLTTGLSVSSIATDKKVKAGGTYFMISRSLGLPIGGTLGLALFVGLSFSVSLYLIGFSESFLSYWNFEVTKDNIRIAGSIILILVATITMISTSLAIKTQYFIMAAIGLSLLSILFGNHDYAPSADLVSQSIPVVPLMVLFGIFFPAVTGFEAGVSMSGDLKDPKKSIPIGSISAILVGLVAYIGLAFFFSKNVNADMLASDKEVLLKISWFPQLVVAGIWGATLSSALGSILGAPRILQATAVDGITHRFFSRGVGKSNEPRNALLLTFVIAEAGILIGELDVIARVVSIFFITTYGFLNLSCAFERWTSADFRPEFKAPIWVSLLGAIACLLVMIQLDFMATLAASVVLGLVFFVLKRKELTLQSGDTWSGVWASLVKSGLEYLYTKNLHTRNWRPNILMFHGSPDSRPHLLKLGKDLCGKLGILTAFELFVSDHAEAIKAENNTEIEDEKESKRYFSLKYATKDIYSGIDEISRVYGFSGIRPNTILMGWTQNENRQEEFGRLITSFNNNGLNSIFLNFDLKYEFRNHRSIDIWWSGHGSNLAFAISIIRYLSGGSMWKDPMIRLFVPISNPLLTERVYSTLERIVDQYRIAVEINVVNNALEKLSPYQLIERESAETDLTIVGLPNTRYEQMGDFMAEINKLLPLLGSTLLINASNQFDEYDLDLNEKTSTTLRNRNVELVPIPQFVYPMLTEEIYRLDKEMDELVHTFFEKTLLPHITESGDWINNLKESVESTVQNFLKANEVQDNYRRNKAFFKIKNEYYFKITSLFEKKRAYKFAELKHLSEKGIQWFIEQIDDKIDSITKSYRIEHLKADFKLKKSDPPNLKWLKLWKKAMHPFAKKSIPVYVNYRELAEHYIKNHQTYMLQEILADFELWSYKFIHDLKVQINEVDNFIDLSGQKFLNGKLNEEQILEAKEKMLNEVEKKEKYLEEEQNNILQNMLASFRREIVAMGYKLEEINANKMARNKKHLSAIASKAKKQILAFPEQWFDKAVLYYNKLNADVIMTSFKSRTLKLVDDYRTEIDVYFHKKIVREIKRLKSKIEGYASELEKIRALKVDINIDNTLKVFSEFEHLNQEVMKLIDVLPKEMLLPREEDPHKGTLEQAIVPLSKISRHFFESRFVGQVADRLEKTEESVVRLIHEINDQMNLTRFSIDNLDDETGIGMQDKDLIIKEMIVLLDEKIIEVEELYAAICQQFENAMDEAFDPLASYKIIESSKAFTTQLRGYQSRRIKDIIDNRFRAFGTSVMKQLARIWYTKSEGVLLAKRLIETENLKSRNEKILDIVEHASPKVRVMNSIPHYYKSLFSGRSNISEEFWVEMKPEQGAFLKAIERYRQGNKGGILITGERNCGKTNLCQYVLKKQFKESLVFHLFPPIEGSTKVQDFAHELAKVTGIHHPKAEIYGTLPFGSVIVIHDMELWWERSSNSGLQMINEILSDIDRHSKSYLFVINMNIFAYELINNVLGLQDHLIGVIQCQPFDSENLKTMIMKRHESSGLGFVLENKSEEKMSQLKMAKLFSQYFDFTNGNPGVTLNTWLSNIMQYKNEQLFIKYPSHIDDDILVSLDNEAVILLQQTALHKRMDLLKMMRVFAVDADRIEEWLSPLLLNGLMAEKQEGVFVINPYVEPFVVKMLKNKELL